MSRSKFLRVRRSEYLTPLEPTKIKSALSKEQFMYIDFADENYVKLLEKGNPQDSDEETEVIGADHIAGINGLSANTYKMLQYLSENRILNEHKRNIDEVVRNRISQIQNKRKRREGQNQRRNLKNYSLPHKDAANNSNQLAIDPDKLEEYLEKVNNERVNEKLRQGERQLQKSVSSAGYYKKSQSGQSLDLKINNKAFHLPQIHRMRYDKSKA